MKKIFNYRLLSLLFVALWALQACDNPDDSFERKKARDHVREVKKEYLENRSDRVKAIALDKAYKEYIAAYPDDTVTAIMLLEDAKLHTSTLNNTDQAIVQLREVHVRFPESQYAPEAMYTNAFLLEQIDQEKDAKRLYKELVEKYPDSEFAEQAQFALDNFGKSIDDILQERQDSLRNEENSGVDSLVQ